MPEQNCIQFMKRKFYIIGHNPNSVKKAIKCLKDGANSIEPDIRYLPKRDGKFFVYDFLTFSRRKRTLKAYLIGLSKAISDEGLDIALLAFDLKPFRTKNMEHDSYIYMEEFFKQLNEFLLNTNDAIPVLLTVGKPEIKQLLLAAKPWLTANQAVGIDKDENLHNAGYYLSRQNLPFTLANGTSSPFVSSWEYRASIKEALDMRRLLGNLKLVYTWTVNCRKTMRRFVDLGVDGMITDRATKLKTLLEQEYSETHELATSKDNPFV